MQSCKHLECSWNWKKCSSFIDVFIYASFATLYIFPFASFSGIGYFTIHFVFVLLRKLHVKTLMKNASDFHFGCVALHRLCRQVKLTLEACLMYTFKVFVNCCWRSVRFVTQHKSRFSFGRLIFVRLSFYFLFEVFLSLLCVFRGGHLQRLRCILLCALLYSYRKLVHFILILPLFFFLYFSPFFGNLFFCFVSILFVICAKTLFIVGENAKTCLLFFHLSLSYTRCESVF